MIRMKPNFWVYRAGKSRLKVSQFSLFFGQAIYFHRVYLTAQRYGPVHLAHESHSTNGEKWYVVSSEPTDVSTFSEYGVRFDISENFLFEKSNGFQLESSVIRCADTLSRLCNVYAMTTLFLVSQ